MKEKLEAFQKTLEIFDELRQKCPWDKKQTNESLRVLTIEETFELSDAILKQNSGDIKKELGDILLHILFYAKIAEEKKEFDIAEVCKSLSEKLIFRHPHIFGNVEANTSLQVEKNWEQLKLKEKDGNKTILGGVPDGLPSLIKAHRIQDKARSAGFDWNKKEDVWIKVQEEIAELNKEIDDQNEDQMEAEFGDLFFSLINAARLYNINPDNALERTNQKFIRRFNYVESETKKRGLNLSNMTLSEMDELWNEAKLKGL